MSLLDGFRTFNFGEGVPYFSITTSGVTFNKAVVMKLGYPEYVLLLINDDTKRVALKVSNKDTPNATPFYKEKKSNVISVRWNSRDLINTITEIMGWDLKQGGYRVEGSFLRDESAMLFNLLEAKPLS